MQTKRKVRRAAEEEGFCQSMGEERLSNLALLCIERDIEMDINKVIAKFAKYENRQMMI